MGFEAQNARFYFSLYDVTTYDKYYSQDNIGSAVKRELARQNLGYWVI